MQPQKNFMVPVDLGLVCALTKTNSIFNFLITSGVHNISPSMFQPSIIYFVYYKLYIYNGL